MLKPLTLAICLASPFAHAEQCPWMPDSRIDDAYPDRAPWTTVTGGQGRCKFASDERRPGSVLSLTKIVRTSPQAAEQYVKTVSDEMAKTYRVRPVAALGKAGVAVRQDNSPDSSMLTLIGHRKNVVVMTQMSFYSGVDEAQQAKALELTKETFVTDTGGGLPIPSR